MLEDVEIKIAEKLGEIPKLSKLVNKFFEKVHPDYTKEDFYRVVSESFYEEDFYIVYATENEKPIGYAVGKAMNILGKNVMVIIQAYSEKPLLMRKMREVGDKITLNLGLNRQVIFSTPENQTYFETWFGFKPKWVYLYRDIEEIENGDRREDKGEENGRIIRESKSDLRNS